MAYVNSVATDSAGSVVIAGRYQGSVNFGGRTLSCATYSNDDVFVAKYSTNGSNQWARGFGSSGSDIANGVAVDSGGNVIVTGYFAGTVDFGGGPLSTSTSSSMFLAKYSPTGSYIWAQAFPGAFGTAVAVDGSDNVVVVGSYTGSTNFGGGTLSSVGGSTDVFVAKFSPTGGYLWAKSYGGSSTDLVKAVAVDSGGNVVVTGYFSGTSANFGAGSWTSAGATDIFVAKYGSDGSSIWAKQLGGTGSDNGYGVSVDGSGNVLVAGDFTSTVDFGGGPLTPSGGGDIFLAKYSSTGAYQWAKHFGTPSPWGSHANGVRVDGSGNVLLTGWIVDYVDFGGGPLMAPSQTYDVFVAKFTPAGAYTWAKRAGTPYTDHGNALTIDGSGNVLSAGDFGAGQIDFGCGALNNSSGGQEGYVAKLDH